MTGQRKESRIEGNKAKPERKRVEKSADVKKGEEKREVKAKEEKGMKGKGKGLITASHTPAPCHPCRVL